MGQTHALYSSSVDRMKMNRRMNAPRRRHLLERNSGRLDEVVCSESDNPGELHFSR